MNKEEKATAYHEAGHALVAYRFNHYGGIVTIVPRGNNLGISTSEAEWADEESHIEQIIVLYAGFASESKYNKAANKLASSSDEIGRASCRERV